MLCQKCGAENPDGATVCNACGSPLDQQPTTPLPGPLDQLPIPPLPEPVPCRACGTPLAPGEKYCSKCRFPVADATPPKKKKHGILFLRSVLKGVSSVLKVIFMVLIIGAVVGVLYVLGTAGSALIPAPSPAAAVPTTAQPVSAAGNYATPDLVRVVTSAPASAPTTDSKLTDGYWCRNSRINVGKAPADVIECYQFFPDGTYKWGYSPGWPMGKSPACPGSPDIKCTYSLNWKGQIEVAGGLYFTVSGDTLVNPRDPPYFTRTAAGIP
ncbi:MAG: zinc ribbon domain-containing protein [Methanoregula sp.]|nr:zinc ribbon domain-containing protein [Methanoregula sp.]